MLVQSWADTKITDAIDGNLWELKRSGTTILGYEDTRHYINGTYWNLAFWFRLLALVLFVAGIVVFVRSPVRNLDDEPDY